MGAGYLGEFPLSNDLLVDCEFSSIKHVNRHVRAAAMAVLEQWVIAASASEEHHCLLIETSSLLRKTTVSVIKTGLADNWSQVRMAASVLCRVFFTKLQGLTDANVEQLYPALLPSMCLNRFYLAQGVKLYSHETWKMVVQDHGIDLIASNLPAVCRYYIKVSLR
jgi:hypothetical protein